MLQLRNRTPFAATILPIADVDGVDSVYAVIKGTFTLAERPALADEQMPVALTNEHYAEPEKSSVRVPSDLCLAKAGTDVVLVGSAWAPGGRPAWETQVSLTVGALSKTVRVVADRVWE